MQETKSAHLKDDSDSSSRTEPQQNLMLLCQADTENSACVTQVTFRHPVDRLLDTCLYCLIEDTALDFLENRVNVVIIKCVMVSCVLKIRIYQEAAKVRQGYSFGTDDKQTVTLWDTQR